MDISKLIIFVLAFVLGAILLFVVQRLIKNREKKLQPKTGFLGKTLMQFSVAVVLLAGVAGAYFISTNKIEIVSQAHKEVKTDINYTIVSTKGNTVTVEFSGIPSVGGEAWGEKGDTFDIFWSIKPNSSTAAKGQKSIDQVETARSDTNPSKFRVTMLKGQYTIKVIVSYKGDSYETSRDISL